MKILFYETAVNTGKGVGGSLISLLNIVQTLETTEYEPVVVLKNYFDYFKDYEKYGAKTIIFNKRLSKQPCSISDNQENNHYKQLLKKLFTFLNLTEFLQLTKYISKNCKYIAHLINVIRKEKINIIHCNSRLELSFEILIAAKLTKTPIIFHYRGEAKNSFFINYLRQKVDYFIAISNYIKGSLINSGISSIKIEVLYNWLNEDKMIQHRFESHSKIEKFKILSVGRIIPWKGQHLLVEIAELLINNGIDNFIISIIGEAANNTGREYLKKIQNKIREKNLVSYFEFLGAIKYNEVYNKSYHLLLHTSTRPEPFGRVIIEAMFNNIPVIATNLGGPKDILEEGVSGFLFSPENVKELYPIIKNFYVKDAFRKQVAENARKHFLSEFSSKNKKEKLTSIYQMIAEKYCIS